MCREEMRLKGGAYPRSCPQCGFGPCNLGHDYGKKPVIEQPVAPCAVSNDNIVHAFNVHDRMTVVQSLREALADAEAGRLKEIVISGHCDDGTLYVRSGNVEQNLTRRDALWLLEQSKLWTLNLFRD